MVFDKCIYLVVDIVANLDYTQFSEQQQNNQYITTSNVVQIKIIEVGYMRDKRTPPKPPGKIVTEERPEDSPELTMIIRFKQDREEYISTSALAESPNMKRTFIVPKDEYTDCKALNHYVGLLEKLLKEINKGLTPGTHSPKAINIQSLLTFVKEVAKHPEYCTTYMLEKLSYVIPDALNKLPPIKEFVEGADPYSYGFLDMVDDNGHLRDDSDYMLMLYGAGQSITPEMLATIHGRMEHAEDDSYRCQANDIIHLLIQICYAILMHYFRKGDIVARCDNCGRYFIPSRKPRAGEQTYCTRKAPQDSTKSCAQYMKRENQRIHNDSNEFKKEHDRILRRIIDAKECEAFKSEYKDTKQDREARRKMIERWATKYPKREKKGAKS